MQEQYPLEFSLKDEAKLVCRPAGIEDFKKLEKFFLSVPEIDLKVFKDDALRDEKMEQWLIDTLKKKFVQLVVLKQNKIIGFGTLEDDDHYWENTAEIKIIVAPEYRRKGIGARLFDLLLYEGLENGIQKLLIRYVKDNRGIIKLLENYGFDSEISLNYNLEDRKNKIHKDLVVSSLNIQDWKRRFEFYRPVPQK